MPLVWFQSKKNSTCLLELIQTLKSSLGYKYKSKFEYSHTHSGNAIVNYISGIVLLQGRTHPWQNQRAFRCLQEKIDLKRTISCATKTNNIYFKTANTVCKTLFSCVWLGRNTWRTFSPCRCLTVLLWFLVWTVLWQLCSAHFVIFSSGRKIRPSETQWG